MLIEKEIYIKKFIRLIGLRNWPSNKMEFSFCIFGSFPFFLICIPWTLFIDVFFWLFFMPMIIFIYTWVPIWTKLLLKNIFGFIFVLRVPIDGTLYVTIYFDLQVKLKAKNMKYTPTLFDCHNVYFGWKKIELWWGYIQVYIL